VTANRIEITVEGIADPSVAAVVETAVRDTLLDMVLPGAWQVAVTPSRVNGRWDFSVRGLGTRHVMSITAPPRLLADLVAIRLRESLHRAARCLVDRLAEQRRGHRSEAGARVLGPRSLGLRRAV
jgi:hypothetical protein